MKFIIYSIIRSNNNIILVYEEAKEKMRETFEDIDKELELKDNETSFSAERIGFSKEKVIKRKKKPKLTEIRNKGDRVFKRLHETFKKHKENKY